MQAEIDSLCSFSVSLGKWKAMTIDDDDDDDKPQAIVTRKEVMPVCLPAVCTHHTTDTNQHAH